MKILLNETNLVPSTKNMDSEWTLSSNVDLTSIDFVDGNSYAYIFTNNSEWGCANILLTDLTQDSNYFYLMSFYAKQLDLTPDTGTSSIGMFVRQRAGEPMHHDARLLFTDGTVSGFVSRDTEDNPELYNYLDAGYYYVGDGWYRAWRLADGTDFPTSTYPFYYYIYGDMYNYGLHALYCPMVQKISKQHVSLGMPLLTDTSELIKYLSPSFGMTAPVNPSSVNIVMSSEESEINSISSNIFTASPINKSNPSSCVWDNFKIQTYGDTNEIFLKTLYDSLKVKTCNIWFDANELSRYTFLKIHPIGVEAIPTRVKYRYTIIYTFNVLDFMKA